MSFKWQYLNCIATFILKGVIDNGMESVWRDVRTFSFEW